MKFYEDLSFKTEIEDWIFVPSTEHQNCLDKFLHCQYFGCNYEQKPTLEL